MTPLGTVPYDFPKSLTMTLLGACMLLHYHPLKKSLTLSSPGKPPHYDPPNSLIMTLLGTAPHCDPRKR